MASDDDVGPVAPYELESESDFDSDGDNVGATKPPAKRPRDIHALGVAGAIGVLPDKAAAETPLKELHRLLASAEVRRIVKDLEEGVDLKLPVNRNRQQPNAASQWLATVRRYTPRTVSAAASCVGLKPIGRWI